MADTTAITAPNTTIRTLRAAGWGAIIVAAFYLLQPLGVFVLVPEATQEGYWRTAADIPGKQWEGVYEFITFGGIAVATLVLVQAVSALTERQGLLQRVGTSLGVAGAVGWLAAGALQLANYSLVAISLAEVTSDTAIQAAVLQGSNIVLTGVLGLAAFGAAAWLLCQGVMSVRGEAMGRVPGWIAIVAGALIVIAALAFVHPMFGGLLLIPANLALGIALLVRSRRA